MNNHNINALKPLFFALVLAFGILIGVKIKNNASNPTDFRRLMLFAPSGKLNQTLEFIKNSYVDSISESRLVDDAIRGMLRNLDPHSQYIPASNFAAVNEPLEGNFSGIGVQFNMMSDTVVIINTVAKGPSEKAGILAGDRIVRVNDSTVAGVKMPSDEIVKMLKGPTGTKVNVSVYRKGNDDLLDFTLSRDRIPIVSIDAAYMITPEIGYIKVNKFSRTTFQEFSEAAENLKSEGMTKMIIDLRDNSGGIIDAAIRMAELFLPANQLIVYTEGKNRGRKNFFSNGKTKDFIDMELALLIDQYSASASEIVAGAIQDNDRGAIIGRRSFGKGLVQEQFLLSDGSAVRITSARYYTPTGRCIQKPYDANDRENYFNELRERTLHGELTQADSVRFNDSLRFVTPGGKVVYGGGGIMPDIFIPFDTTAYTPFYRLLVRRRLINNFAFDFADKNRRTLSNLTDYKAMQSYLIRRDILNEFLTYAEKQGVARDYQDLKISGALIENVAMAFIARNILDDKGFYPILNQMDEMVKRGVEVLEGK